MKIKIKQTSGGGEFDFPAPLYFWAKLIKDIPHLAMTLHRFESYSMNRRMREMTIESPIYITGLARSGTTVLLEMLAQHRDIASHRYLHMVLPYAPHWCQRLADYFPIMTTPSERLHKDGLFVTRDNPEAVEEIFWQESFDNALDESLSNVLGSDISNPKFEKFYRENIKKLLINRNVFHYLAKNNYNITRMEYLLKLFPNARFIIMIRNPFNHIASLIKQDEVFNEIESKAPTLLAWTQLVGHREFGSGKICINLDDFKTVQNIRKMWKSSDTYVEGWALYWASVYEYVYKTLQNNPALNKAVLVVRYEDMCDSPSNVIDKILDHIVVDTESFKSVKQHYCNTLRSPTYYHMSYSEKEQEQIFSVTSDIALKFGYAHCLIKNHTI